MPSRRPSGSGGGGGGGGGGDVATTKRTYKTVLAGVIAEMDPWLAGSGSPIITVEHGLARQPDFYETYIECVVATSTDGYSMGDRVPNVHTPWRITVRSDDTNTYLISSNSGSRFGISDLDSNRNSDDFTASQWKFVAAPYIFVDTQVVTNVAGGGGSGDSLFLDREDVPTEEDWEAHKGKWTGRVVAPIDRALVGPHASVARFAAINNDPVTSGFGYEILSRTVIYSVMRDSFATDVNFYWEWRESQAVEVGDLAYRLSGGTEIYSIAIRAHTTIAGNVIDGPPNETNQTGWVTHAITQVVNHANFAGVVGNLSNVDTTTLSHGSWVASIVNDFMSLWTYSTTHGDWLSYVPSGIGLHATGFADDVEAADQVRGFDSGAPDYYLIGGELKILIFYVEPTAGDAVYFANPRLPGTYFNNPQLILWGAAADATDRRGIRGEHVPGEHRRPRYPQVESGR